MIIKKPPNQTASMIALVKKWKKFLLENRKPTINIFLDMDGVLVDFDEAIKSTIVNNYEQNATKLHPRSPSRRKALRKFQDMGYTPQQVADLYDAVNEKHKFGQEYTKNERIFRDYFYAILTNNKKLWIEMKKLQNSAKLVNNAFEMADNVYVLSAPVDKASREAKREWIAQHYPAIRPENVYLAEDKGAKLFDLINRGEVGDEDINILVDDRPRFLKSFSGAGGKGVEYDYKAFNDAIDKLKALVHN